MSSSLNSTSTTTPSSSAPQPAAERTPTAHRAINVALRVVEIGPVLVLIVLAAVMALLEPLFLTENNVQNLLVQSSVIATLGIGQLLVILTRGIDLSVGSTLALSSVVGGLLLGGTVEGPVPIIGLMLVTGAAVGLFNGVLLVWGRIPHAFIVTLATLSIVRGLALTISDGQIETGMPQFVLDLGSGFIGVVPVPAVVVGALALTAHTFTRWTRWGRWIYAVGGNPEAAKEMGIPVKKVLISVYVLSGLSAGFAGMIVAGRTGTADPAAGNLAELDAIAAVIIGGASFFGGRGAVPNVLIGALTIGVIRNGLDLLGVTPFLQLIVIGGTVLAAVELDVIRTRLEARLRLVRTAQ